MSSSFPDSSKKLLQYIISAIQLKESDNEILSLAHIIMENIMGINQTDIIVDRSVNVSSSKGKELNKLIARINDNEPIQYILGETEFYGRKFFVGPEVLIPRHETEELVHLIIAENKKKKIKLLDIGTGSGCIPISLMKEINGAKATAIDFDPRVIKMARRNADFHNVAVDFMLIDILEEPIPLTGLDVIVSNPPYIGESEKWQMKANVLDYEPHRALFVKDSEPLIFYIRIAELAHTSLKEDGVLYFEINENYGQDVVNMLVELGYSDVKLFQDLNGKDRMVRAGNSPNIFS